MKSSRGVLSLARQRYFSCPIIRAFLLSTAFLLFQLSSAAELVSSNYLFGDLRLQYEPPTNNGGEAITKYKIEWDAATNVIHNSTFGSTFTPSSQTYGYAEVTNIREEQDIVVTCRSLCAGSFLLSWGGRITEPLSVDATADEVETAISFLVEPFNIYQDGTPSVKVTRKINGFTHRWRVTFMGVTGDIGLLKADGDLLVGSGPTVRVDEVTAGSGDLYPGDYTNEVQTISVRKRKGFACETLAGSFTLSFEGSVTSQIDIDSSAQEIKAILESLDTIHSVNVRTDHHTSTGPGDCSSRSWIVTFTNLVHETRQASGDLRELKLHSSSLTDPAVSMVQVYENIKGTYPRAFSIVGLVRGLLYYCRVSAYNALGYGVSSVTVSGTPMNQPPAPLDAVLSLPDASLYPESEGTSLKVSWRAANEDGGDPVTDYKVEWYSSLNDLEVQKLTTSSSNGVTEVQSITTSADTDSITGFFTLTFNGETTELIAHDADADGEESVEAKLERLSTIGDVEVSRSMSWISIPDVEFDLISMNSVISRSGGRYAGNLVDIFSNGDTIKVGGEVHTISTVGESSLAMDAPYSGTSASSVNIHKWSYGYEWLVTFASHIGEQTLLEARPANNWAGTNPTIEVIRVQKGLQPLSGTFRLSYGEETTIAIPFDADEFLLKQALEALGAIGEVNVERHNNNNGYNYFVTFLSDLGDLEQLTIDDSQLTGPEASARMATLVDGVIPSDYGSVIVPNINNAATMEYKIDGLGNGISYYVRIRSKNLKGYGYASNAAASPMTPLRRPSSPTLITMIPLSDSRIRIAWQAPDHNGGAPITKYAVQWDTEESFPSAWTDGFYYEQNVEVLDKSGILNCHTFEIDPASANLPRFGRVLAHNGYKWSVAETSVMTYGAVGTPGPVRNFNAFSSSKIGIVLRWDPPTIDDKETCNYAGDGGSPITHYVIEYDVVADFSSPATSVMIPSSDIEFRIGGRDVLSGSESSVLEAGGTYYARIVPFNALGAGVVSTFPSPIGPLTDDAPSAPVMINAYPVSATSVRVDWDTPSFDGGSVIQEYLIEYDAHPNFDKAPRNVSITPTSEVHALQISSDESDLNVHVIQATVKVTNEVQLIKSEIDGVDEVQKFSTTCDDVTAEVQMIVTTAVDTNEEQVISLIADDIDEIQVLRVDAESQPEIQSVQVSVERLNEVQKLGVVISNINTDGDGVESTACMGLNVGDSCQAIEDAISGFFTVSFDFDQCGGDGVNYCQLAILEFDGDLGTISCSPGFVTDPFSGGDHCVSEPVVHSYSSIEGDVGTLQHALNNLVDDNGVFFMNSANMPGKQEAVTVSRQGRIKTKGSCTIDPLGLNPASCSGEYELLYEITFDSFHTSGDVPPITIVTSNYMIDKASASYTSSICPFLLGCEDPIGAALDSYHASFYNGDAGSEAVEYIKGSQPTGFISLDYECESAVTNLPVGHFMTISADGMTATFDYASFVSSMVVGQWIRFSAGDGLDHYRRIDFIDLISETVSFEERAPILGASYSDVEYGDYFSDWSEANGVSGVSNHCASSRIRTTLPIDVNVHSSAVSQIDWKGKVGALAIIDSSGVLVSRHLAHDLSSEIGLIWEVTFQKQPGNVHSMNCRTVTGNNECSVSTLQDASFIGGGFKLQTMWPHEYVSNSPILFETNNIRWNANPSDLTNALESIKDAEDNKVFGTVHVTRTPYKTSTDLRWSGGYDWAVTFLSRGGNIPALTFDESALIGLNARLSVSDEDSGDADLFRGVRNRATFPENDPGLARDGNQVTGSFALSWPGNAYHSAVISANVFRIQTGGASVDQYTALSAEAFKSLFEEHILQGAANQIDVVRSEEPTQWMGYSYTIKFRHGDVGGDVPELVYMIDSTLGGSSSNVRIDESIKGTELVGTFQLRYEGETTRPIMHDATAMDVQNALNELNSIAPSAVVVSGGSSPIRAGPADGVGGTSTQVKGRIWYVTFASNVWKDPTVLHESSFVPGNWVGPPTTHTDTWSSGFSKAWGKNVGNVPLMSCLSSGLTTTNGVLPENGCSVSEVIAGTDPLGGFFKVCLDSASNSNGIMSVESDSCTEYIAHNAVASAVESGGDGSSVEEKLESLDNIGDVHVTRSAVNMRNGGYTWTVQFLRDVDGPCQQKDDLLSLCNSPGNVAKLCDLNGQTPCDTTSLMGSCMKPGSCTKLTVLDEIDHQHGISFPGGNEKQIVFVKDSQYLGWEDGSVVDVAVTKEYRLVIDGISSDCIKHNALPSEMAIILQNVLDVGIGGNVRVDRIQTEDLAQNGFVYYLTFYDTGDVPLVVADFSVGTCGNGDFEAGQSVVVASMYDGAVHPSNCNDCVNGIVQRGGFQQFEVDGDNLAGSLAWNAGEYDVKNHLEQVPGRTVHVSRTVLDKYGAIEWMVTFSANPNTIPSGSGNVASIIVDQDSDTSNRSPSLEVSEVARGSDGLSGTFELNYQGSSGARAFSFDESPERMQRKLEEMSTIGRTFVTRDCYPDCTSGGWGGNAISPGTIGGYQWKIFFLTNPGSDDGFTFPPGSGVVNAPDVDHSLLSGEDAAITTSYASLGGMPLTGSFQLIINGRDTEEIPYNINSAALKQTIDDLQAVGHISVESASQFNFIVPGITATVVTDGSVAYTSGDLREHIAPGESFRIGGSDEFDGAELAGSAVVTATSPILSNVQLVNSRDNLFVGEQVRIGSDVFSIAKNGIEIQQLTVHRSNDFGGGEAYQLSVTVDDIPQVTSCLTFDASAEAVEGALNSLPYFGQNGGVLVTKSEGTSGFIGSAHFYKIYFIGQQLLGDVDEIETQYCSSGVPSGMDSTNSHFHIRTLIQGGMTEHQRISLASDAGTTNDTPSFQLTITDLNANSWTSPCFKWGIDSLDIASVIDETTFSTATLTVSNVEEVGDDQYKIEASGFLEGIVMVGDLVNPGKSCMGNVLSIDKSGRSTVIDAPSGCDAVAGDSFYVGSDIEIIDSSKDNGASISEITLLSLFADAEVESDDGLYKINVEFNGVSRSTSCLLYDSSAEHIQQAVGTLFDFNMDGIIDSDDADHIRVTRKGDGSSSSGFGYTYEFLSAGSSTMIGPSSLLGSLAPKFSILDVGSDGGCMDSGVEDVLVTTTASTTDKTNAVILGPGAAIDVHAGARLRISSSLVPSKVYTVDYRSIDGNSLFLTESFEGSSTSTASLYLIRGGIPQFDLQIVRNGVDEYSYDIFFTGSHWRNVPEIQVNIFGDGVCAATFSDIADGMSRNIGIRTLADGGGQVTQTDDRYVLDRFARQGLGGLHNMFVVPPTFVVQPDLIQVYNLFVFDDESTSIWGSGQPSYKISFEGEETDCIAYNAFDFEVEAQLNSLTSLCSGIDTCVTVTRQTNSLRAPNGHLYTVYFDSALAADTVINDSVGSGFAVDATHPACNMFDSSAGERVFMEISIQGQTSLGFHANQVPFQQQSRWIGESQEDLPIYRVSGSYWTIQYDQSLGNVEVAVSRGSLPINAQSFIDTISSGSNPTYVIISGLSTGIPHYFRTFSRTSHGFSRSSNVISAIPSDKPLSLQNLFAGHALHINEVQLLTIAASHQKEVQAIHTSAIPISEVQEVSLIGAAFSDMSSYLFSLRHPEIQIVKWSSGSPVTFGSFFLKLLYVDRDASEMSGSVTYKELQSSCIPFDASADEVKTAIEGGAVLNGLSADSVRVIRSGNRSYSSDYGYTYEIHFVGGNVRGNMQEFTSEGALNGMDASGGSTCDAFVSSTNDASIEIWTKNDSLALGTDTPRTEIILDTNTEIFDGEFQVSVTYLGQKLITECIPWNASANQVENAFENLDNVDSVRVDSTGDGRLSNNGAHTKVNGYLFDQVDDYTFVASPSEGLASVLHEGDIVQFSNQDDASIFYEVTSLADNRIVIDKAFVGSPLVSSYVTRFFGYRHVIYFDGNAMHINQNGETGFQPQTKFDLVDAIVSDCRPIRAYHNNVLRQIDDIPGALSHIRVVSAYDGGENLPGAATASSSKQISVALTSSLPMTISEARVTQSLETANNGVTFTITYGNDDGNVPLVVCNYLPVPSTLAGCEGHVVIDGNTIGGSFYLGSSDPIPHDASASEMESAITGIHGIQGVEVTRTEADGQGGYVWKVTFIDDHGDVPILNASNSLTGKGAAVSVSEITKGNELGGSYSLAFGLESTIELPFDAPAHAIKSALESLPAITVVTVNQVGSIDSEGGTTYAITFNDAELGDVELLTANTSQLTGLGAIALLSEKIKGSLASKDSLHLSFDAPRSCSVSDVGWPVCGDSISEVSFDISGNSAFDGHVDEHIYRPDYSYQIIRTSRTSSGPAYSLSGYFNIAYDGYISSPLSAQASANDVRIALERLPGIKTVKVEREYASQDVSNICIDVVAGSSIVQCSSLCSPCSFRSKGIVANQLIKIGSQWFRVSSTYDGAQEYFNLASEHNSLISKQYVEDSSSLSNALLQTWSGGYEWNVSLLDYVGVALPLTTPIHHLLPSDAAIDISTRDCKKCVYLQNLMPGAEYSIRGRLKNSRGNSDNSNAIVAIPRGIPTAPINVRVNSVSGACLEVAFDPPIYGQPFTSYTVEWDSDGMFINAQSVSASCSSLRYGSCTVLIDGPSPYVHEICDLLKSESYYVRVSVTNSVHVQSIHPSGNPQDNTNWANSLPVTPSDQVPGPPVNLNALVLGKSGLQLLFNMPSRDGGQAISHFVVEYGTSPDFSDYLSFTIEASMPKAIPASGGQFVFDFVPTPLLVTGVRYFIRLAAINSVGLGMASTATSAIPSGPSDPPGAGFLSTLVTSHAPITEAKITWTSPYLDGGYPVGGYVVEWWSEDKQPEIQIVRLQYNTILSDTTFTLSFSPSPTLKKVTSNLPWNAPADLVRRELLNLGWDESDDSVLLSDVHVARTSLAKGYQWTITFGDNPDRSLNDGDQVTLVGSVTANGDLGLPSITVSTTYEGQRSGGKHESQYLQIVGTGTISGYYRIKFMSSEWTSFISVHADAAYVKNALEQLSTVDEVDVIQNDGIDQATIGTNNNLVHHYDIIFRSNPGNLNALVIDATHVSSSDNNANVLIYDGNNALNSHNTMESATMPGEMPLDYGSSGLLQPTVDSFRITGLESGKEYFVSVSAKSPLHGMSKRLIPTPKSITPTLQTPGAPQHVALEVNAGYSDSLLINFDPPESTGGSEILFYRVELDPTESFDDPIFQDFQCPPSNKRTEWEIKTSVEGTGIISGGSFTLELDVDGFTSVTSEIPYNAVALASNETGTSEELIPTFSTLASSTAIYTIPSTNIEGILFPGDRLRFSGQSTLYEYYEVVSVTGAGAIIDNPFAGSDGVQVSTTRHYGGRGTPLASRIHCQYDQNLCPHAAENRSGSLQSKLEDLSPAVENGVYVDRDGPSVENGFIWRITFMDDARPLGSDYQLRLRTNSLTTYANQGTARISVSLLNSGQTYSTCSGSLVIPSYGGLVKGLEYHGRVSARNSEGYSLPMQAPEPVAPKVVPAAPTGVSLSVVSATALRLMFGSPADNGGDSITGYLVEWSKSSAFTNVQSMEVNNLSLGSPFFANIEGLDTGSFYFVRVKAKNSQGYGVSQMSTPSSLNPHQRPSAPSNVKLGITSDTMLSVGWEAPLSNGGDTISKYRIEWDTHPSFSSFSEPPNNGYVDVGPTARSHTIELLSTTKNYYVRVQAFNTAGGGSLQTTTPSDASPRLQPPGSPFSLQVFASSTVVGRIEVVWQRPRVPFHQIPCSSDGTTIIDCPTPYSGTLPSSDGGEAITEYELEYNERRDFSGPNGGRQSYTGYSAAIDNLYSGREYFVRILARNSVGSGRYCAYQSVVAP